MHVIKWNLCASLLCFLSIAGCGTGPDDLKRNPDKPGTAKQKSTTDKPEAPKEKATFVRVTGEKLTADYKMNKEDADKAAQEWLATPAKPV